MQSISRVVEVANPASLSMKDLALRVERDGVEVARVPLEDLGILLLDGHGIVLTNTLLAGLALNNVALAVSGPNHIPAGLMLPIEGNSVHARILRDQIALKPMKKGELWRAVVIGKLKNQAAVLKKITGSDRKIRALMPFVRRGDPDNIEARAAQRYFLTLFDDDFVRVRHGPGLNSMLDYGYAVVRAAVARSVVMAGMHPALGIHHRNQYNAFALADDLMEPLRPVVDEIVYLYVQENGEPEELTPPVKRHLLRCLTTRVMWSNRKYPILTAIGHYVTAFRECMQGKRSELKCPGWMSLEA
ncbi:MAG: type II CRISPR-associated endonuclease Cas1 [Armatimonadota bacterium]